MLTVSVAFGQTPYKLNYPDITIGNSPTGKIVLNGSNLRLPRIATSNAPDSLLALVDGKVVKVVSSVFAPTVTSVNGRTGAVTGLAELNQNNNFTGNQTIAGRLTVNGTAGTSSATGPSAMTITGGNGWSNTATSGFASGGAAGPITMRGGNGGNSLTSSGTQLGGKGGGVEIIAGNGGLSGTSGTNGNGGDATLQAGSVNLGGTNPSKPGDVFLKGGQNDVVNGLGGSIYILPGFGNANSAGVNADLTHDGNVFLGSNINGARRGAVVVGSDISDITNDFQVTGNSIFKGLTRVGATTGNNLLIDPNPGGNVKIRAFNNGGNQALEYVGGEHIFDGQLTLLSNISVPSYRANDFVINHENSAQKISLQNTGTNKLEVLSTGVRVNNLSGTDTRMVGVDATGLLTAQSLVSSYANVNGSNATGTWPISVNGNSATTTKWGGIEADFTQFGVNLFGFLAYNEFGMGRSYSMEQVKTALGVATQARYTASGNGSSTAIVIPHGLTGITSASSVIPFPNSAAAAGLVSASIDATNITINYTVAPPAGTNNLIYSISIK